MIRRVFSGSFKFPVKSTRIVALCLPIMLSAAASAQEAHESQSFDSYPACSRIRYIYNEKPGTPFTVMTRYYQNLAVQEAAAINSAIQTFKLVDRCGEPFEISELFERQPHCDWSGPYLSPGIGLASLSEEAIAKYRKMNRGDFQAFRTCYYR